MTALLLLALALNVRIETTAGNFTIELHPEWAPNGAARFEQLVRDKYYDDSRFFRVVPGKWAQFGIAGVPATSQKWRTRTIPDDVPKQKNLRGIVAFANTGPNTRATEVFINLTDNPRNDQEPGFAPFGKVIGGMGIVDKLYSGYAETSGGGMRAGHQDPMFTEGNAWLDREFPNLSKLLHAVIE